MMKKRNKTNTANGKSKVGDARIRTDIKKEKKKRKKERKTSEQDWKK